LPPYQKNKQKKYLMNCTPGFVHLGLNFHWPYHINGGRVQLRCQIAAPVHCPENTGPEGLDQPTGVGMPPVLLHCEQEKSPPGQGLELLSGSSTQFTVSKW
jgi:hypothetical protein